MSDKKKSLMGKLQEFGGSSQLELLQSLHHAEKEPQEIALAPSQDLVSLLATPAKVEDLPSGFELRPERKSARFQLRLPPTVLEQAKDRASESGMSLNQWILEAMDEFL